MEDQASTESEGEGVGGKRERIFLSFCLGATLLQGSDKASFKGRLDLGDNGMLGDEGFKP